MKLSLPALVTAGACLVMTAAAIAAEKNYGPGVTDTEITLGQTNPYSGPVSAFGQNGHTNTAYFNMINAQGGINGRKIKLISLDDGYMPSKTVEDTRKLVEEDGVLAMFAIVGTPSNLAVQKYLNAKKVPQLLSQSGSPAFIDPKNSPWTTTMYPSYSVEGKVDALYLLKTKPDAKIAIIYQHDPFGEQLVDGFKAGLGDKAKTMIVREASYEIDDPSVDSQVIDLYGSGADTLYTAATPKFAAQVIRKVDDLKWKPLHLMVSQATSIGATLRPAGVEKAVGIISAVAFKTPLDPTWDNDKGMQEFISFMKKWNPNDTVDDISATTGYLTATVMTKVLRDCGDDLTRENVIKHATDFPPTEVPILLPGVTISMSPTDYRPFHTLRMARFDGVRWAVFGDPISVE